MDNLLLQGSYYDSILKISNFGYSKSAVLDSVAVTLGLGGGGQGQVPPSYLACCKCVGAHGRGGFALLQVAAEHVLGSSEAAVAGAV